MMAQKKKMRKAKNINPGKSSYAYLQAKVIEAMKINMALQQAQQYTLYTLQRISAGLDMLQGEIEDIRADHYITEKALRITELPPEVKTTADRLKSYKSACVALAFIFQGLRIMKEKEDLKQQEENKKIDEASTK